MTTAPDATGALGMTGVAGLPTNLALPSVDELMAELRAKDPQLAAVVEVIAARRRAAETNDSSDDAQLPDPTVPDDGVTHGGDAAWSIDARELARLAHLIDELGAELEVLRYRNDAIAAAVGACHLCWGEDARCLRCWGAGVPGWVRSDPWARRHWLGLDQRSTTPPGAQARPGASNRRPHTAGSTTGTGTRAERKKS